MVGSHYTERANTTSTVFENTGKHTLKRKMKEKRDLEKNTRNRFVPVPGQQCGLLVSQSKTPT